MFSDGVATFGIPLAAILGVLFAIFLWHRVSLIKVSGGGSPSNGSREYLLEEEARGENEVTFDIHHRVV